MKKSSDIEIHRPWLRLLAFALIVSALELWKKENINDGKLKRENMCHLLCCWWNSGSADVSTLCESQSNVFICSLVCKSQRHFVKIFCRCQLLWRSKEMMKKERYTIIFGPCMISSETHAVRKEIRYLHKNTIPSQAEQYMAGHTLRTVHQ